MGAVSRGPDGGDSGRRPTLADRVDSARYNKEVDREVAALDFDVYVAPNVPGYRFAGGELSGMYRDRGPKRYAVSLVNELDRVVTLTSFRFDPATFDPPRNCGWPAPSDVPESPVPCTLVGETPDHVTVYAATDATTHDPTYYAHVGRSVVTLKDANTFKPIPQDLAIRIFGSLEKASATRLRELQDRVHSS